MIDEMLPLIGEVQSFLWLSFAILLRLGGLLGLMPAFGEQTVPIRIRLAIALVLSAAMSPILFDRIILPQTLAEAILACGSEIVIGVFLGLLLRLFVLALSVAGSIAAQSTSLSQIFGGSAGVEPQPAIGHLMVVGGLALAAMFDLHLHLIAMLVRSYDALPFGSPLSGELVLHFGVQTVSTLFAFSFSLAAPFLIASVLYNVTLGVINRAMPQLMVSFVGAPVIAGGSLLLLFLALPYGLSIWVDALTSFMMDPFERALIMADDADTLKEHEPTQKKLDDARKKGEIPRSNDANVAAGYAGFLLATVVFGGVAIHGAGTNMLAVFEQLNEISDAVFGQGGDRSPLATIAADTVISLWAWFILPGLAAIGVLVLQRGIIFVPSKLQPKLNRISPISNAKNKFGRSGLFGFFKSFLKLTIYSTALAIFLYFELPEIIATLYLFPAPAMVVLGEMLIRFLVIVLAVAAALAIIDILFQRTEHTRKKPHESSGSQGGAQAIRGGPDIQGRAGANVDLILRPIECWRMCPKLR
jgi:flagellar biosynthetic protein FliR